MPRKNLIRCNNLPYHVTSRANNKEWFALPMERMWTISQHCLKQANEIHKVEVLAFVLMSNHYHLLVRTPEANLDLFMYEFNKRIAQELKFSSSHINHILGSRYKWCLIHSQQYYLNCYRYIYQNPRRALIVQRCEDYPYSTLHSLVHNKPFSVPIHDAMGFKDRHTLNWINEKIDDVENELLKKGLRRSELRCLTIRETKKPLKGSTIPLVLQC
jgi:putative transposase